LKLSKKAQDNMTQIQALEDKYHPMIFQMALVYLVDVGYANFDDASIEERFKQISEYEETEKTTGKKSILTPDVQREILSCAVKLSAFSVFTLFAYIKKYFVISHI